jgi:polysaccharide deacetylase family protein (PEP-CTERM system associated)
MIRIIYMPLEGQLLHQGFRMKNAFTVDLEDYMHVTAFASHVDAGEWSSYVSRLEHNTDRLLSILEAGGCHATFFVLGWVAEKYPHVIRKVADAGHEIACHSLRHRLVYELTPEQFREDTRVAKQILEDVSGNLVSGYRAPSFSITKTSWWALGILRELGFTYDSSVFPVKHPNYGFVGASRFAFAVETPAGTLVEFPLPTLQIGSGRAPLGGGAYLRLLPYSFTRWGISYINNHESRPVCVYLHPWELDSEQPRMKATFSARLRHYLGLRGTEAKVRNLLRDFEFCPLNLHVEQWQSSSQVSPSPGLVASIPDLRP